MSAAILAAGLDGIKNNLDPGKRLDIDMYSESDKARGAKKLPLYLLDSIREFSKNKVMRSYLGEEFFNAYLKNYDYSDWTYLQDGPFDSIEEFECWLKQAITGNDPVFYAIIDLKTEKAAGICAYLRIQPLVGVIELGKIHFSPLLKKTTMATEAMYLMMRRAFDELCYRRCEWKCDTLNAASRKTALRLGFTFEGIFRQALVYKGRNRDTAWYSVVDKNWPKLKKSFEIWLRPENFNSQGEQQKSLSEIRNNLDV